MTQSLALLTPDMTAAERQLVLAAVRGAVADLAGQSVRGAVLRDLLEAARPGWVVHAKGLRLQRARLTGGVDLEGCVLDKPIFLSQVVIETDGERGALLLEDACLRRLSMHDVRLEGAMIADRAKIEGGLYLSACDAQGLMQMHGTVVRGALAAENTQIGNGRLALDAAGLEVTGAVVLRRTHLRGHSRLVRARIAGGLQAEASVWSVPALADQNGAGSDGRRPSRTALDITGSTISGDVTFADVKSGGAIVLSRVAIGGCLDASRLVIEGGGLDLSDGSIAHAMSLDDARMEGVLDLGGARLGRGFSAHGLEVHGGRLSLDMVNCVVAGDVDLEHTKLVGALECRGSEVNGNLRLASARLYGADVAMEAAGLALKGRLAMDKAVVIGCIRLSAAVIGDTLSLGGASLKVDRGVALTAEGVRIGRDALFDCGLRAIGAIALIGARVGGTVSFAQSSITAATLAGDAPEKPLATRSRNTLAAMAHEPSRADDHAIVLADASIHRLIMPRLAENRPRGIVDLSCAHAASLEDYAAAWPAPFNARSLTTQARGIDHLILAGFRYDVLVNPSGEDASASLPEKGRPAGPRAGDRRISWLEAQSAADVAGQFVPDAWLFLSNRLAAQGLDDDARRVNVVRRRRQARSQGTGWISRWRSWAFDLVALYGYGPWRTLACLAVTVLLFSALYGWAARQCAQPGCMDGSVFIASRRSDYAAGDVANAYPPFNPFLFSLDAALPVLTSGASDHWRINTRWSMSGARERAKAVVVGRGHAMDVAPPGAGQPDGPFKEQAWTLTFGVLLECARILEMLLGAVLAALAIMGFAGLLRDNR